MKLITKVAVLLIIVKLAKTAPDPCMLESEESACNQTEYEAYKECVHNESKNDVRKRRQSPCPQNNLESLVSIKENCKRANFDCRIGCGDDENCQAQCPVCPINVDELIASNNSTDESHRTIIVENDQTVDKFQTINAAGNVTTVIRLTNIINTTSSAVSEPTVDGGMQLVNETGGEFGLGVNANGSCCYVVHPKTCTSTSNGRRCHHRREKMCGRICTAKVVHVQARRRCTSSGCHKKISYIPQPKPPKCIHTRKWPYVACGQSHSYSSNCDGCYDHYDDDNTINDSNNNDCDGCYDDGFDYGPLYRQGPVFRPLFYHVPPCYIVGTCLPYPISMDYGYGYGYFGGRYDHKRRHHEEIEDEELDFDDVEDADYDLVKSTAPANKTDHVADDWAIELQKCKVVSDNGTIEIRNCTTEDIEENPYAGAPTDVEFDTEDEDYDGLDDGIRIERHASNHHQFRRPRIVYVPVLENFNNGMATSDEYDFDEAPRHRRKVGQSKTSAKRNHRKAHIVYDDEDDDEPVDRADQ
ncbi:uncharacterized protein LOC119082218 [Bradysia coprophila]|uniref:uncharacterized protein LOC119082218 n=1 Tax=Bradysia coprophila TaxID=38358 RepID=UPI00187DD5C6|nr:uncharacterized protein LOC119082218 [Bradysia coprophila]